MGSHRMDTQGSKHPKADFSKPCQPDAVSTWFRRGFETQNHDFFRNLGSWSTLRCNKSIVVTSMIPSHNLGCCGVSAIGLQLQNTEFRDFLFKMINFVTLGVPKMANTP